MVGLIFLAIVGLWVWLAFKASKAVSSRITPGRWRRPVTVLLFLVLLPLPVLDEIIGGFQFRALCEKNAKLKFNVDPATLKDKSVRAYAKPSHEIVGGTLVEITHSHEIYRDAEGGQDLLSFDSYRAKGGLLIRLLSMDDNMMPMTFTSSCDPLTKATFELKSIQHGE